MKKSILLGLFLAIAACSGGGASAPASSSTTERPKPPAGAMTLSAVDYKFSPSTIALKVGTPVTLFITNDSTSENHDLKSSIPITALSYARADNAADEQKDNVANNQLDVDFALGHYAEVTFTPTTAGTFPFSCGEPGHKDKGMQGAFVVTP